MTEYKKLTKKTMPPIDNRKRFIIWLDARSTDGGFPTIAQRVQYNDNAPYIMYVKPFGKCFTPMITGIACGQRLKRPRRWWNGWNGTR